MPHDDRLQARQKSIITDYCIHGIFYLLKFIPILHRKMNIDFCFSFEFLISEYFSYSIPFKIQDETGIGF